MIRIAALTAVLALLVAVAIAHLPHREDPLTTAARIAMEATS